MWQTCSGRADESGGDAAAAPEDEEDSDEDEDEQYLVAEEGLDIQGQKKDFMPRMHVHGTVNHAGDSLMKLGGYLVRIAVLTPPRSRTVPSRYCVGSMVGGLPQACLSLCMLMAREAFATIGYDSFCRSRKVNHAVGLLCLHCTLRHFLVAHALLTAPDCV